MKKIKITLIIACTILMLAMPASSDFILVPPRAYGGAAIGMQAGNAISGFFSGINELKKNRTQFNKDIAAARKDFFSKYPDKPGVEEAGAVFSELLAQKDMIILDPPNGKANCCRRGIGQRHAGPIRHRGK